MDKHPPHVPHPHHPPHPHPVHPHPPPHRRGRTLRRTVLLLAVAGMALLVYLVLAATRPSPPSAEALVRQMKDAAAGVVVSPHVFGGALRREGTDSAVTVTAEQVPSKPCVSVGWVLARDGPVTVNGVLLPRLSAASLAELCRDQENGAILSWSPRP